MRAFVTDLLTPVPWEPLTKGKCVTDDLRAFLNDLSNGQNLVGEIQPLGMFVRHDRSCESFSFHVSNDVGGWTVTYESKNVTHHIDRYLIGYSIMSFLEYVKRSPHYLRLYIDLAFECIPDSLKFRTQLLANASAVSEGKWQCVCLDTLYGYGMYLQAMEQYQEALFAFKKGIQLTAREPDLDDGGEREEEDDLDSPYTTNDLYKETEFLSAAADLLHNLGEFDECEELWVKYARLTGAQNKVWPEALQRLYDAWEQFHSLVCLTHALKMGAIHALVKHTHDVAMFRRALKAFYVTSQYSELEIPRWTETKNIAKHIVHADTLRLKTKKTFRFVRLDMEEAANDVVDPLGPPHMQDVPSMSEEEIQKEKDRKERARRERRERRERQARREATEPERMYNAPRTTTSRRSKHSKDRDERTTARRTAEKEAGLERQRMHEQALREKEDKRVSQQEEKLRLCTLAHSIAHGDD